ncbi:nuclear receptor coactivator 5 isoform X2 [Tachyglossus aculeatus]|uniref:nuclear receptor coactivator 5 isoform X2 n=1 Tax=Tachyglossus aculeatus TaxID=9261 RepID=UPI0018F346F1|nr:nuclear receptor coactivator 5 isoform X2 [Tachyglossus aculeatus]
MSSWVKVTSVQGQRHALDKSTPVYKSYPVIFYPQDLKECEVTNSIKESVNHKQYDYATAKKENCERYQYSQKGDDHSGDDRRELLFQQFFQQIRQECVKERPSDCTIVSVSKEQRDYSTAIGYRLQDHGLVVEMIYLSSESGLTRALQEVKNDGSPFCILVEQSNVTLSSCTVIMLQGSITIRRHMPLEDALTLVAKAFGKILAEREKQECAEISQKAADLVDDYLERELSESYSVPLGIRHLLFLLSEGKHLSWEELNLISNYVKRRNDELEGSSEKSDPIKTALFQAHKIPPSSLANPTSSLLPTPVRTPLAGPSPLAPAKPSLLVDGSLGSLLLPSGSCGRKGKPPLFLATPAKRPSLLGCPPHPPAKRSLLGEKPGLLPAPVLVQSVEAQRIVKLKPLLS